LLNSLKQKNTVFIKNRTIMSKFDPNRKEKQLVKSMRNRNYVDYEKKNAMNLFSVQEAILHLVQMNFKKLFQQNISKLEVTTRLKRHELVFVYSTFVSMYMF